MVGGFTIQAGGALLLFMEQGNVKFRQDGRLTMVIEEIAAERESRFNDVIADPVGHVYCGIMTKRQTVVIPTASLISMEPSRSFSMA